jgi:hypothetical protein
MASLERTSVHPKAGLIALPTIPVMAFFTEMSSPIAVPYGHSAAVSAFVLYIGVPVLFAHSFACAVSHLLAK